MIGSQAQFTLIVNLSMNVNLMSTTSETMIDDCICTCLVIPIRQKETNNQCIDNGNNGQDCQFPITRADSPMFGLPIAHVLCSSKKKENITEDRTFLRNEHFGRQALPRQTFQFKKFEKRMEYVRHARQDCFAGTVDSKSHHLFRKMEKWSKPQLLEPTALLELYHRGRGRGHGINSGNRRGHHPVASRRNYGANVASTSVPNEAADSNMRELAFFVLVSELDLQNKANEISFVVDSGATNHLFSANMIGNMKNVEEISPVFIKIANGESIVANLQGSIRVRDPQSGHSINIEGLIAEQLPYNLLSVRKINKAGFPVYFENNCAKIVVGNDLILCETQRNLFIARFEIANRENAKTVNSAEVRENSSSAAVTRTVKTPKNLWHLRLGHINRRGLQLMNLPYSEDKCDSCQKGKSTRQPFKTVQHPQSSRVSELIHTDVWGPSNVESLTGERYYLSITDDYSHFSTLYPMKNKSEAESNLRAYIQEMEASGRRVSRIRMDNGGEYISKSFKEFCKSKGIVQEFTCKYTSQQSGISERLNRTILDKVRAMFVDTGLPKSLWREAVCCATYQLNRSPTKARDGKIPADIFLKHWDVNKLRIFGSKAWYHRLPRLGKLEPRGREARMVGYAGAGYRLYDPELNQVIISRDVVFDETDLTFGSKTDTPSVHHDLAEHRSASTNDALDPESRDDAGSGSPGEEPRKRQRSPSLSPQKPPPKRAVKLPSHLADYEVYGAYCLLSAEDPQSYDEALGQGVEWKQAIDNELSAMKKFGTWTIEDIPEDKKPIQTKWVFRTKQNGTKKARLVAKGYQEDTPGNLYAPVAKIPTVRMFLCHALNNNLQIRQLDVPSAFLNGNLKNDVYIEFPDGVKPIEGKVLKLRKALYGLKESPRVWNERFNEIAEQCGLVRSRSDTCLYTSKNVKLVIWVDDLLLMGPEKDVAVIVKKLQGEFNATDLGKMKTFLGTDIEYEPGALRLSQKPLIDKIIDRFHLLESKSFLTPMETGFNIDTSLPHVEAPFRELVGSLIYLATITRPDIAFAAAFLGRYLNHPTQAAWKAAKRVAKYIKGTRNLALTFVKESPRNELKAYADADWASDCSDRKSVSGAAIFYGRNLIYWSSKKQQTVALSTAESEFYAAALCASEILHLRNLHADLSGDLPECTMLMDNQSAIAMVNNYENSRRAKHIDIKTHFIRDVVAKGLIKTKFVPSEDNVSDVFTKPLCSVKFEKFRNQLNIL
ncbi:unnamed protein product [Nesidiocoris tenuis]|uniref:Integrase catalytic domain-containing protein n=1 Tax=Nesidiocoris tenuis TaxID=355587 RepID=A0A6H5HG40_9HEMI|nr:unnamed protein product [Nesidiocoris tenuis]